MKPNLILIRHGQSEYNLANRFAGWVDTPLTEKGIAEADAAGKRIHALGFVPDEVWVSPLTRARHTANTILAQMNIDSAICQIDPRLVERSYGGLSGKNKAETKEAIGVDEFQRIRRGFAVQPPALTKDHPLYGEVEQSFNTHMKGHFAEELTPSESLEDVVARTAPFVAGQITNAIKQGKKMLVVAHGNSLRAIIKQIKQIDDEAINKVELATAAPTGFVVTYENDTLKVSEDSVGQELS